MDDAHYMRLAIEKAREGISSGQSPFGAAIVRDDHVLALAHNTVWRDTDPTAHAEVNAIRQAAAAAGRIDLRGCTMFSTCEPCPMCLTATHWSKIDRVVYGATIADSTAAGFSELRINAKRLVAMGRSPLQVASGLLEAECRALFDLWKAAVPIRTY